MELAVNCPWSLHEKCLFSVLFLSRTPTAKGEIQLKRLLLGLLLPMNITLNSEDSILTVCGKQHLVELRPIQSSGRPSSSNSLDNNLPFLSVSVSVSHRNIIIILCEAASDSTQASCKFLTSHKHLGKRFDLFFLRCHNGKRFDLIWQ